MTEHHELAEIMEVSINRIMTARQEVSYIYACLKQANHTDAKLWKAIQDELVEIGMSQARILGYISRTAVECDKTRSVSHGTQSIS